MSNDERIVSAIVVGYVDYGDQDRIVTLLSSEQGKLSVMARNARSGNKRSGLIDLGNTLLVSLKKGKGDLFKLTGAEIEDGRHRLRQNLNKIAHLSYFCEISAALAQNNAPEPKIYGLLSATLKLMAEINSPLHSALHVGFECKALAFSGHLPRLSRCGGCDNTISDRKQLIFSPDDGGVWHNECFTAKAGDKCYVVEVEWLKAVSRCIGQPLAKALEAKLPKGPHWIFSEMIENVAQRRLKSKDFLQQLATDPC